jgi:uncharacterized membrane protein YuzA (DUF378 family)
MATLTHGERRHIPDRRNGATQVHSEKRMKTLEWIPMLLLIIGGINWGLVGLFNVDLVAMIFGEGSRIARVVYALVGLSALYSLYLSTRMSSRHV